MHKWVATATDQGNFTQIILSHFLNTEHNNVHAVEILNLWWICNQLKRKCRNCFVKFQIKEKCKPQNEKNKYVHGKIGGFVWEIITNRKWFKHTEEVSLAIVHNLNNNYQQQKTTQKKDESN